MEINMIKLGNVFSCSWGYDQTNVDYYQVTRVISDKTIEVTPIESIQVDKNKVMPNLNKFCGEAFKRRLKNWYDNTPCINGEESFMQAKLWDGKARYETPFNEGH